MNIYISLTSLFLNSLTSFLAVTLAGSHTSACGAHMLGQVAAGCGFGLLQPFRLGLHPSVAVCAHIYIPGCGLAEN